MEKGNSNGFWQKGFWYVLGISITMLGIAIIANYKWDCMRMASAEQARTIIKTDCHSRMEKIETKIEKSAEETRKEYKDLRDKIDTTMSTLQTAREKDMSIIMRRLNEIKDGRPN